MLTFFTSRPSESDADPKSRMVSYLSSLIENLSSLMKNDSRLLKEKSIYRKGFSYNKDEWIPTKSSY